MTGVSVSNSSSGGDEFETPDSIGLQTVRALKRYQKPQQELRRARNPACRVMVPKLERPNRESPPPTNFGLLVAFSISRRICALNELPNVRSLPTQRRSSF